MKNLKKILALAVAFVMCFTMFAGAAVYSDVPAGSDYSEAVTLLSDLGVIAGLPDGTYGVDQTITRRDAACLIARMMTGQTNPVRYAGTSNFIDVPKDAYYEAAVAYCAVEGITQGTGNGMYSPERTITDAEFIAMVTRALGYDTAAAPLAYPMGNIAAAEREGLLDGVTAIPDSPAQRGEDAQIIYNALFADYDAWAKKQNVYQGSDDQHLEYTIAEEVFGLSRLAHDNADYKDTNNNKYDDNEKWLKRTDFYTKNERAEIDCDSHTFVIAGVDARNAENEYEAYFINDDDLDLFDIGKGNRPYVTFTYNGDIEPLLGYQVELWGDSNHTGSKFEVIAIKTVKGQTAYDWNRSMGKDGSKIEVEGEKHETKGAGLAIINYEEDSKKNHNMPGTFTDVDEAPAYDVYGGFGKSTQVMDNWLDLKDGDQYKAIDWDSDGDIDFFVRDAAKYAMVEEITSKRIVVSSVARGGNSKTSDNDTKSLPLDDDNLIVNAEGIEKGDIVEIVIDSRVYDKDDDEVVTISMAKVEADQQELTKVSTKGDLASIFNETEYEVARTSAVKGWNAISPENPKNYAYDEQEIGTTFDLYLDRNGYVVYSDYSNGKNYGYLMVLETEYGTGSISGHSHNGAIKAKLDNDRVVNFDVVSTMRIYAPNGRTDTGNYNRTTKSFDDRQVVGRIYKYYTNEDGDLTKLVEVFNDEQDTTAGKHTDTISVMTDEYSYIEKSDSLKDEATDTAGNDTTRVVNQRYGLEKAEAVFAVKQAATRGVSSTRVTGSDLPNNLVNTTNVATNKWETYILEAGNHAEHLAAVNGVKLVVDERDVIAIDADDIPDIATSLSTTTANSEDMISTAAEAAYTAGSDPTWLDADREAAYGYTTRNRIVTAAILGVDDFRYLRQKNVKVGLITKIDAKKGDKTGEYIYEIDAAVDGKVQTFLTESVEGLEEIGSNLDNGATVCSLNNFDRKLDSDNRAVDGRGGIYAEIRFDGELIDSFYIMNPTGDDGIWDPRVLVGQYYSVVRAVIGNKVDSSRSYFEYVQNIDGDTDLGTAAVAFHDDEHLQTIEVQNNLFPIANWDASTQWYKIDGRAEISDLTEVSGATAGRDDLGRPNNYRDVWLQIGNWFDGTPEVSVATSEDLHNSFIDARGRDNDEYWVADLVVDRVLNPVAINGDSAAYNTATGAATTATSTVSFDSRFQRTTGRYMNLGNEEDVVAVFMFDDCFDEMVPERAEAVQNRIDFYEGVDDFSDVDFRIRKFIRNDIDNRPVYEIVDVVLSDYSGNPSLTASSPLVGSGTDGLSIERIDADTIRVNALGNTIKTGCIGHPHSTINRERPVAYLTVRFVDYRTVNVPIYVHPAHMIGYNDTVSSRQTDDLINMQVEGNGVPGNTVYPPVCSGTGAAMPRLWKAVQDGLSVEGIQSKLYVQGMGDGTNGPIVEGFSKLQADEGYQFTFKPNSKVKPKKGDVIEIIIPTYGKGDFHDQDVIKVRLTIGADVDTAPTGSAQNLPVSNPFTDKTILNNTAGAGSGMESGGKNLADQMNGAYEELSMTDERDNAGNHNVTVQGVIDKMGAEEGVSDWPGFPNYSVKDNFVTGYNFEFPASAQSGKIKTYTWDDSDKEYKQGGANNALGGTYNVPKSEITGSTDGTVAFYLVSPDGVMDDGKRKIEVIWYSDDAYTTEIATATYLITFDIEEVISAPAEEIPEMTPEQVEEVKDAYDEAAELDPRWTGLSDLFAEISKLECKWDATNNRYNTSFTGAYSLADTAEDIPGFSYQKQDKYFVVPMLIPVPDWCEKVFWNDDVDTEHPFPNRGDKDWKVVDEVNHLVLAFAVDKDDPVVDRVFYFSSDDSTAKGYDGVTITTGNKADYATKYHFDFSAMVEK